MYNALLFLRIYAGGELSVTGLLTPNHLTPESTHPIYEIKKDYSEGGLWYLASIVGQSI